MRILVLFLLAVVLTTQMSSGADAQVGSPFERNFSDIKFLNAYFGHQGNKIEVSPGDKNVPFTVVFANVGSEDITGIRGQLQMHLGFSPADGKGALILADSNAEAKAGNHFALTFFVNLDEHVLIQQYPANVKLDYSRLREAGTRTSYFDILFRVTGESILNLKASDPFLTSLQSNMITVEVTNSGNAPISNMKVVLENTQTALSSTTASVTNMENVVFDQNKWNLGTISPKSTKHFTFNVYIPEGIRSDTLRTVMNITYLNAHGDQVNTTRSVDFFISGLIDAKIYDIRVIEMSERQTVIGEIINEGNTNAMFSFVTLEPLGDSNIKATTQFIDKLDTDSPVPFNIPVEFEGEPTYGEHEIKITVRYKDGMRNEHLISEQATIVLKDTTRAPEPTILDHAPVIVGLIIAAIAGSIIYKKVKKKDEITS